MPYRVPLVPDPTSSCSRSATSNPVPRFDHSSKRGRPKSFIGWSRKKATTFPKVKSESPMGVSTSYLHIRTDYVVPGDDSDYKFCGVFENGNKTQLLQTGERTVRVLCASQRDHGSSLLQCRSLHSSTS